jgi:hypothetical protein
MLRKKVAGTFEQTGIAESLADLFSVLHRPRVPMLKFRKHAQMSSPLFARCPESSVRTARECVLNSTWTCSADPADDHRECGQPYLVTRLPSSNVCFTVSTNCNFIAAHCRLIYPSTCQRVARAKFEALFVRGGSTHNDIQKGNDGSGKRGV